MVKRVTKQRVAVALICTVWLTSIVGASVPPVPLGETTAFPNLRSSGPSSDQYTPRLRNPPNYQRQDHHGRGWMNDPHPRINVRNSQEEKFLTSGFESAPNYELINNRKEYNLKNYGGDTELDNAEVQRLSSIKLAFDDPIDFSDQTEEENEDRYEDNEKEEEEVKDWRIGDGIKEDGGMQRDEFLGDDTFEDEGPGSVEVYKLDLFRDTPILNQRSGRRISHEKTKSKIPKKVNIKSTTTKTITIKEFDDLKSREGEEERIGKNIRQNNTTTRSLKERIFGTGGVPELQVGCEGVEGSQRREKRSENDRGIKKKMDILNPASVNTDIDYDLEDYYDLLEGPEDPRYPMIKSSRGDMDPKIKTPADIEARKILLKGQLPKRGDLGDAWEESLSKAEKVRGKELEREKRNIRNDDFRDDKLKRRHRKGKRNGGKKLHINNKIRNVNELGNRKRNRRYNTDLNKFKRYSNENERKLADYIKRNTPINPIDHQVPANLIYQNGGGRDQDIYAMRRKNLLEQRRPEATKINRATYEEEQRKREASKVTRPDDQVIYKGRTRQEIERLKNLPLRSLIVIDVKNSSNVPDIVESRFGNEVSHQPSAAGPSPCAWAIINCCSNKIRLTTCFEAKGCPGGHWDNPCTDERISSALNLVAHYYMH